MQSVLRNGTQHPAVARVKMHADSLRVAASHDAGAGWRADSRSHAEVCEHTPLLRHPVETWRAMQRRSERFDVAVPEVVAIDDDKVGFVGGSGV